MATRPTLTDRADKGERQKTTASAADKHELYQEAVQCVEAEIDFVDETYLSLRGRRAKTLREDFCGTANTACEWVRRRSSNQAYGVDLDAEVLDWGRRNNLGKLSKGVAKRISLIEEDVTKVVTPIAPDVVLAMNFSYWIFRERKRLRRYFRRVRKALAHDGLLFVDVYGGHDAFKVTKDRHKNNGFTYVWDQASYNPITGDMIAHIHFAFPDGSKLDKAFTYVWRLWTLPELQEVLSEAGFLRSTVYWQGTDEDTDSGDGEFTPSTIGDPDPAWIAYLVAEK